MVLRSSCLGPFPERPCQYQRETKIDSFYLSLGCSWTSGKMQEERRHS